jgi:hypothetical protein
MRDLLPVSRRAALVQSRCYGLGPVRLDAVPDGAGAARFDALLGLPRLQSYYQRTTKCSGPFPRTTWSFRCSASSGLPSALPEVLTSAYFVLVCFSAVYLNHHYIVDLMAGFHLCLIYGLDRVQVVSGPRKWAAPMSPKENA